MPVEDARGGSSAVMVFRDSSMTTYKWQETTGDESGSTMLKLY